MQNPCAAGNRTNKVFSKDKRLILMGDLQKKRTRGLEKRTSNIKHGILIRPNSYL